MGMIETETVKAMDVNPFSSTVGLLGERKVYRFDCALDGHDAGILKEALELYLTRLEIELERCSINSIRENIKSRIDSIASLIGRLSSLES